LSVALKSRRVLERNVTEHRSLDEFAEQTHDEDGVRGGDAGDDEEAVGDEGGVADEGGADDEDEADDEAGVGDGGGVDDETSVEERVSVVEPGTSTSRYEPAGATCAACDAEVGRLWVDDDELVCADCKPW
jgi:hypothetical protein